MVSFDHVEVVVSRMGDEFARGVGEGYRILLQFYTQFRYLEDPRRCKTSEYAS